MEYTNLEDAVHALGEILLQEGWVEVDVSHPHKRGEGDSDTRYEYNSPYLTDYTLSVYYFKRPDLGVLGFISWDTKSLQSKVSGLPATAGLYSYLGGDMRTGTFTLDRFFADWKQFKQEETIVRNAMVSQLTVDEPSFLQI